MNALDDLLMETRPVPEAPDDLRRGRVALDAAISTRRYVSVPAARAGRTRSWLGTMRAKLLLATAVAAAGAVAAAVVIALPQAPAGQPPVTPTMAPAPASLTAATVLSQAARAAAARAGWPDAQYWYAEEKYWCDGQLYTERVWDWRYGNGVAEKSGPSNGPSSCTGFTAVQINDSYKFGIYTWSQLFTLPTDPAVLKAKLMADFGSGGGFNLFVDIGIVLEDSPAPPAVRAALFKVDASIPGVKVTGRYTDPLGRTGIAIQFGSSGFVVDPASGEVIDDISNGQTAMYVTQGPAASEPSLGKTPAAPASTATPPKPAGI